MTKEQKEKLGRIAQDMRANLDCITDVQSKIDSEDEDYAIVEDAYQTLRSACETLEDLA